MSLQACESLRLRYVKISKLVHPSKRRIIWYGRSRPRGNIHWGTLGQQSHDRRFIHLHGCLRQESLEPVATTEVLEKFKSSLALPKKTHTIGGLWRDNSQGLLALEGEIVVLHGYLGPRHDLSKNLSFVTLKDPKNPCQIQVVSSIDSSGKDKTALHEKLKAIRPHSPVVLSGCLKSKPEADRERQKRGSPQGDFEIVLQDVQCLNEFPPDIILTQDTEFPPEQRHLQLRTHDHLTKAIYLRSAMKTKIEILLNTQNHFTDIETPLLFKSTSEGAREFIVPTRRKGLAYALPQSPQQFKQILMASGFHRYYQFARCFRDEDLRADRQPEFTQIDIEMAFADGDDVIAVTEKIIHRLWNTFLKIDLPFPFPRMTYRQAMSMYGSDKPDLRNPISPFTRIKISLPVDFVSKITPLKDPIIEAMVVPMKSSPEETRRFMSKFLDLSDNTRFLENPDGGPGVFVFDSSKPLQGLSAFGFEVAEELIRELILELQDGYLIILQARKDTPLSGGSTPLGDLRNAIYKAATSQGPLEAPSWNEFRALFVTDFPLFSPSNSSEPGQGGNAGLASTHHPFTSPKTAADVDLLLTDPTEAIGDHYDLVINGEEIGGGSRRIHHAEMQEIIFRNILKMDDEHIAEFSHLLEALRSGCPPHAGIALGFDRLVAMVHSSKCQRKTSLRDVIAFPKSGRGDDLMVKSPAPMSKDILETYHLELRD